MTKNVGKKDIRLPGIRYVRNDYVHHGAGIHSTTRERAGCMYTRNKHYYEYEGVPVVRYRVLPNSLAMGNATHQAESKRWATTIDKKERL